MEQHYDDNFVFVPIRFAKELLNYENQRSSLEINSKEGYKIGTLINALKTKLGKDYIIKDKLELHASLYKAMKLEKVFVFFAIILVIAIASINIFFSLSMLVIEKKKDMAMLLTMGATQKTIKAIYLIEGFLIGLSGAMIGLLFGFLFCKAQQIFGFIGLGADTSILDAYPVAMQWKDFLAVGISTFLITLIASVAPAIKASKITIETAKKL